MFYVYVLRNLEGTQYIGSTDDLDKRVQRHQNGGVRWTSSLGPWEFAYYETFPTLSEAMRRERVLKNGKANQKLRDFINKRLPLYRSK
jgi:predicted GIY-YIG superfamily endonuclease